MTACAIQATDIPNVNLTPGSDGNLSKDALDQVYTIFLNQSGNQTSRPSDKDDQNPTGKLGKISYALDGGTLADGSLTEYGSANYGYTPPEPTKAGFTFAGWSPASIPTDSTGNITFTAQWEESSAELLDGESINVKMKRLAGTGSAKYTTKNTTITAIQRTDEKPTEAVMADYNSLISTDASTKPVYAWFENGVIKWWSEAEDVNAGVKPSRLCYGMQNLTDISGLNEWQTGKITDMSEMFEDCSKLTDLTPLANWQTGKVHDMSEMFYGCSNLTSLAELADWDTGHVTRMSSMFSGCSQLTDLTPLANWQTGQVTDMGAMFKGCSNLADLAGLADWDMGNVTDMSNVFENCSKLTDLTPLANWQTGKVDNMGGMFDGCSELTDLTPLANWQTGKVNNMSAMFMNCVKLTNTVGINSWNTSKVRYFEKMFTNCPSYPVWYNTYYN